MSYSRWIESVFYTFADATLGGFTVMMKHQFYDEKNFSDKSLLDIDKCLEYYSDLPDIQIEELRGYMNQYIAQHPERFK